MHVLIVENSAELGRLWQGHLERQGNQVTCARSRMDATALLDTAAVDVLIIDLDLEDGNALTVADYANYRQPEAQVIFVTASSFFSDGSIFAHSGNARAFVPTDTPPEDLAAMVEHYGTHHA